MYRRKKKSTHRRTTHRRSHRRVSGIKDVDFTQVGLVIGGAFVGRLLFNKLSASTNATMMKLAPYAGIALGVALPMVVKSPMVKALSLGLVATGGVNMLVGLKVISGMENTVTGMPYRVGYPYNAIPYTKKIAGMVEGQYVSKSNFSGSGKTQANVIAGMPEGSANPGLY